MLPVPIKTFRSLTNVDKECASGFAPQRKVRHFFLWTILDYVNEKQLGITMADVWRRMCYSRNIQEGPRLREVCIVMQGMPVMFMWDWPLSLYLHWWLGAELGSDLSITDIGQDERAKKIQKSSRFKTWCKTPFFDRVESMSKIPQDPVKANALDFEWRCYKRRLNPETVKTLYPVHYSKSGIEEPKFYLPGSLDWLQSVKIKE